MSRSRAANSRGGERGQQRQARADPGSHGALSRRRRGQEYGCACRDDRVQDVGEVPVMWRTVLDWFGFGEAARFRDQGHDHGAHHGHTHGVIDPSIAATDRGIWAVKWSFVILAVTALLQLVVVGISGSVALLADTVHNIGD